MSDSDLTPLLTPHWSQDVGPRPGFGGTGQGAQYGQGTVLAWNPDTGENQIRYRGTVLNNVPLIGSTDILVMQPGDQVAVMSWAPRGGSAAYWVMGRLVVPGSAAAARSIQFLQTQLAKEISAEVFAERVHTGEVGLVEQSDSATYGNLATVGPTLTGVEVTAARQMLVLTSSRIHLNNVDGANSTAAAGYASFEVSGASSISPIDANAAYRNLNFATEPGVFIISESGTMMKATLLTAAHGLNAGTHTVQMKYRRDIFGGGSENVRFGVRTLTVIAS